MFERFTERARQVVVLAQDESRRLGHGYIGTEHILLGLLREEEGIAARVLDGMGVTLEEVRAEVDRLVERREPALTGQIPFTPGGNKTLELALQEAVAFGHHHSAPSTSCSGSPGRTTGSRRRSCGASTRIPTRSAPRSSARCRGRIGSSMSRRSSMTSS